MERSTPTAATRPHPNEESSRTEESNQDEETNPHMPPEREASIRPHPRRSVRRPGRERLPRRGQASRRRTQLREVLRGPQGIRKQLHGLQLTAGMWILRDASRRGSPLPTGNQFGAPRYVSGGLVLQHRGLRHAASASAAPTRTAASSSHAVARRRLRVPGHGVMGEPGKNAVPITLPCLSARGRRIY